jgi:hypothetical protein
MRSLLRGAEQGRSLFVRTFVTSLLAAFTLTACSQPRTESDAIELPLSAVDGFSRENHPAPIETAYNRYKDALIAIEGIRLGPGLPAGLGSHQYVPPEHGKRYRIVGRIVPAGSFYEIAVEDWEELPLK